MSLLRPPTELRFQIWHYLTPHKSHPNLSRDTTIMNISHKLPLSLQCTCLFLYHDVTGYFYSVAAFETSPFLLAKSDRSNPHAYDILQQASIVQLRLDYFRNYDETRRLARMERDMKAIRTLNEEAQCLEKLVVMVCDTDRDLGWDEKREFLEPLKNVKKGVSFVVGKVICLSEHGPELRVRVEQRVRELDAERA